MERADISIPACAAEEMIEDDPAPPGIRSTIPQAPSHAQPSRRGNQSALQRQLWLKNRYSLGVVEVTLTVIEAETSGLLPV
jgi:hypothetical protein